MIRAIPTRPPVHSSLAVVVRTPAAVRAFSSAPNPYPGDIAQASRESLPKAERGSILTRRIKVKPNAWPWLNVAAREVNQVWNWCNETSAKAARPYAGPARWLSGYELGALTAGASQHFAHIGADTIIRTCSEYAGRRLAAKSYKLRWRSKRSLGWIPFRAENLRRHGRPNALRFYGKSIRLFESLPQRWRGGSFSQDSLGAWYLNVSVQVERADAPAPKPAIGIDLGLKDVAVTSDGERMPALVCYRDLEERIRTAQRRGHKRRAKRLHRTAANRRRNAIHKFTRRVVDTYQHIVVGDVSSTQLAKTHLAKSVLDSGWGMLKTQLQYKGEHAGRCVQIVNERNTTRVCSNCGCVSGPAGLNQLAVRRWDCVECGASHDRDVNAARNILAIGLRQEPPSAGTRLDHGCRGASAMGLGYRGRLSPQKVPA